MNEIFIEIRHKRLNGSTIAALSIEYHLSVKVIRIICKGIEARHIALGIRCRSAKLDDDKVKHIRLMISQGFLLKNIASFFSVSISAISDIKTGRSWQHVP